MGGRGIALRCATVVVAVLLQGAPAQASVVERGYTALSDGTRLHYTLTLPAAEGRFPVVLKYDPYNAGAESDPTWNDSGYAMLGVNFRGTGCSQGTFQPLRGDLWGADGAEVVAWAAAQPWSDGNVGMIGYSFTGVSQLATAAFAGPALKAITPGNVFPDLYRDLVYPGGIHNGWIPGWIAIRNYFLGSDAAAEGTSDPECAGHLAQQAAPNESQSLDTQAHPYLDAYWATQPAGLLDRVRIPVLGCVNWQDTTVYSRPFDAFSEQLDPDTTWLAGGNGAHADCPSSRARLVRFLDRYLKQRRNGWEATPHVLLAHEQSGVSDVYEAPTDHAGAWQSAFRSWSDMDAAIKPVALHLREDGRLALEPPAQREPPDEYAYPAPTANTPADFAGQSHWSDPTAPGSTVVYTTPALEHDAEFLGGGSADLWIASTASDTDVQITLSEVRPDGQEMYVQNGWLRLSHRRLDPARSTALRPYHTHLEADAEPLTPGEPAPARVQLLPFNHVFRAGSAIRLSIDAPGGFFQMAPQPATNAVHHEPGMASRLVLGRLPGNAAQAPLPSCGTLFNQPCRASAKPVPAGGLAFRDVAAAREPRRGIVRLLIGRASGLRAARPGRPFRLKVRAVGGRLGNARITLSDARGRRVGASRRFVVGERARAVRVSVGRRMRPGRYRLSAAAFALDGTRVTARRPVRVRR
jgi:putative CocE/NonD family hydrolase